MSDTGASRDVRLACSPGRSGNMLTFPYRVENRSGVPIHVIEGMPVVDRAKGTIAADDTAVVIVQRAATEAVIGKCLPPLPHDRMLLAPPLPLVSRLAPGEHLERVLETRMPLAETSPYLSDRTIRDYEMLEIEAVILAIGYWPADTPGLAAIPIDYAPERLQIVARDPANGAKLVWQRYPVRGLHLFKRTDEFPRGF